jgi:hypothetical protein
MEQTRNEEFRKADLTRDISGLSFAEVCKACMTSDPEAEVTLVLQVGKGRAKKITHKAKEWMALGASKNVVCKTLHIFNKSKFQVNGESR